MGAGLTLKSTIGSIPVFQNNKDIVLAQGGFALDTTALVLGAVLFAGHPFLMDEATRLAKPLHVAKVYENATGSAVTVKVAKGHTMVVGDYLAAAKGGAAYAITAIDQTNSAYDVLTVGTTLGVALTAGQTLFASTATGASAAALPASLKGVLYSDVTVAAGESVSVALEASVYARRVPYTADIEAALPKMNYSQSY